MNAIPSVVAAKAELARAVRTADLADDPLRHALLAISLTLDALQDIPDAAGTEMEARVARIADQITAAAVQEREAARNTAIALIGRAGEAVAERLHMAADEAARTVLQRLDEEADRADRASRVARRCAIISAVACFFAVVGAAGWLSATLF